MIEVLTCGSDKKKEGWFEGRNDLTGDLVIGGYVILRWQYSMVQHRPFEWELEVNLSWRLSCVLQVI